MPTIEEVKQLLAVTFDELSLGVGWNINTLIGHRRQELSDNPELLLGVWEVLKARTAALADAGAIIIPLLEDYCEQQSLVHEDFTVWREGIEPILALGGILNGGDIHGNDGNESGEVGTCGSGPAAGEPAGCA
jgi:hypothetical protein